MWLVFIYDRLLYVNALINNLCIAASLRVVPSGIGGTRLITNASLNLAIFCADT
jgi:hypothetical protein